jgi:predicted subunit of tRNA(5-methylaminomethyl-2-thiouridylate) methyltransferase
MLEEGGAQIVSLLFRSSLEALVVGKFGLKLELSAVAFGQSRYCSEDANDTTGMIGLCSVAK